MTTGQPELVKKELIKSAWDALVENGSITADDIPNPGQFRSSFIMALLSKLECIKSETNPFKVILKDW